MLVRYLSNGQFYKYGSPIFIMLGGEWTIGEGSLQNGQMFEMAEIHNAPMFYTEHRYYGESHVTTDWTLENLRFLTVDQALADVANFIVTIKENNPNYANSKVVVFGCSYAGTMATWMRQKYPHLVHAAVASSGPLLYDIDYHGYNEIVSSALGSKCGSIFRNASKEIRRLISIGNSAKVEYDFQLCHPFKHEYDIEAFFVNMAIPINGLIQYAGPNTVNDLCTKLDNADSRSDYYKLSSYYFDGYCKNDFESTYLFYKNTAPSNTWYRQWFYQTCTKFGNFQTSWTNTSLFDQGMSTDFYSAQCYLVFGPTITKQVTIDNVAATNRDHGGLNPAVTRVVSVQGSIDPWHGAGLPANDNPSMPTYMVPLGSHCQDTSSINSVASEEMYKAKLAVRMHVAAWLTEP